MFNIHYKKSMPTHSVCNYFSELNVNFCKLCILCYLLFCCSNVCNLNICNYFLLFSPACPIFLLAYLKCILYRTFNASVVLNNFNGYSLHRSFRNNVYTNFIFYQYLPLYFYAHTDKQQSNP